MSKHGDFQDSDLGNEVGPQGIQSEATESEGLVASYSIIAYSGNKLPKDYLGLIYAKWLRSLRYGNDLFRLIDSEGYYRTYHRVIAGYLAKPDTMVRLAVLAEDIDVVLGFSVSRNETLDYVYVNREFRRLGVGTQLVPRSTKVVTHLTKTALTIWGSKYKEWKFNPFV